MRRLLYDWGMVAAVVLCALTLAQHPAEVKKQLADWKPLAADRVLPSDAVWVRDAEIAGRWSNVRGGMQVWIEPILGKAGQYRVECSVGSCIWRGSTKAIGRYEDGILALESPVIEIEPVDRFYAIRVRDKVRLVSPKGWTEMKGMSDRVLIGIFSYGRLAATPLGL